MNRSAMEARRRQKPDVGGRCRKHPKHHQSPGVCSVCLREKLSQLSGSVAGSRRTSAVVAAGSDCSSSASSLSSSSESSLSASSYASPMHSRHVRWGSSEAKGYSFSFLGNRMSNVITKSRSVVMNGFAPEGGKKEKRRFWVKLLGSGKSKRREEEGLGDSSATRESSGPVGLV
ncbi:uncharacterized protein LOC131161616 [Malania oleifera]|uniref:uncharacterized protein LOC131161616 n=1 Tax=Malania oleifera TaxID=397392 RepID=UPI0025AE8520|nr:uncharacterized protein LOC131161616 [Malania oleifera]